MPVPKKSGPSYHTSALASIDKTDIVPALLETRLNGIALLLSVFSFAKEMRAVTPCIQCKKAAVIITVRNSDEFLVILNPGNTQGVPSRGTYRVLCLLVLLSHLAVTTGMPTVKQSPDGNVALKWPPPSSHQQTLPPEPTVIYFALAAFGAISFLCFALGRFNSISSFPNRELRRIYTGHQHHQADPETYPYEVAHDEEAKILWIEKSSPSPVRVGGLTAASVPDMEKQHSTESRGVSRTLTNSDSQFTLSYAGNVSNGDNSQWPPSLKSSASTISEHGSDSAGGLGHAKHQESGPSDGHHWGDNLTQGAATEDHVGGQDSNALFEFELEEQDDRAGSMATAMFPYHPPPPPPPPPLTPPTLSSIVSIINGLQERHPNYVASSPDALDGDFIHQPNPDYMASTTVIPASSQLVHDSATRSTVPTVIPQRWSYTKRVPIGSPKPSRSTSFLPRTDSLGQGSPSPQTFSSSSYPPSSPQLPPGPPGAHEQGGYDDSLGQEGDSLQLQGEIITAVDGAGHGWKRHTRVYGGGVCLACAALGKTHGSGGGGYYGPKVPLSERR